jgi:hypothetical protein
MVGFTPPSRRVIERIPPFNHPAEADIYILVFFHSRWQAGPHAVAATRVSYERQAARIGA